MTGSINNRKRNRIYNGRLRTHIHTEQLGGAELIFPLKNCDFLTQSKWYFGTYIFFYFSCYLKFMCFCTTFIKKLKIFIKKQRKYEFLKIILFWQNGLKILRHEDATVHW